ncbi:MAG: aminotransferase class IV [Bacteroidota bacterium]
MININGELISKNDYKITINNRGFKYGDAVFETLKSSLNNIYFVEDHYFRLMSSMRMLRMNIPDYFNLEYFRDEIIKTIKVNKLEDLARVRFTVFRKDGGLYLPKTKDIDFIIEVEEFKINDLSTYQIELYKDLPVLSGLLSNIKTNNRIVNVLASVYADDNGYDNCILLNEKKNIVEAINANVFLVTGNTIKTPALAEGCINGIIRKKIIEIILKDDSYELIETQISPFELLHVDEVFLSNSIIDIQSVTEYRKKKYNINVGKEIKKALREL